MHVVVYEMYSAGAFVESQTLELGLARSRHTPSWVALCCERVRNECGDHKHLEWNSL